MANRILVVEDDTAISELICMNLEVTGYEVVPVLDGNEVEGTAGYHAAGQRRL